jgi:neurofibromin 1
MADASTKTYREFEYATLAAIVPVSDGLTLRPPGDETEQAGNAVKTRIFYRYYAYLVKVLERSHLAEVRFMCLCVTELTIQEESLHGSTLTGTRLNSSEDHPSLALAALSNLLATNLDAGLKHCLSLGYHEDPSMRTHFMRLLCAVLQRGARFSGLSARRLSTTPRPYLELLTSEPNNLALAVAICESSSPNEVDEISLLLFRVFEAKGNCLGLVKILAEREIAQTSKLANASSDNRKLTVDHESELFRANSITTRVLTIFARTYG